MDLGHLDLSENLDEVADHLAGIRVQHAAPDAVDREAIPGVHLALTQADDGLVLL
jgi:hypothetical protein